MNLVLLPSLNVPILAILFLQLSRSIVSLNTSPLTVVIINSLLFLSAKLYLTALYYDMLPASLPPPVILRASARLHCFAYVDLRAYALIGHTPRSETPMVVQQADHMINVCMCVHRRKRGVWMEGKGGRDERRGEGGGGGVL